MTNEKTPIKPRKKKRTQWDKAGKYKYLIQSLHRIFRELKELKLAQRYMVKGLQHYFDFDEQYLTAVVCSDEVDYAILNALNNASSAGLLPRDVALELSEYRLKPWNVTQRIRRMNKRLDAQIGKFVAEKRGLCWALTSFSEKAWSITKKEMEKENS